MARREIHDQCLTKSAQLSRIQVPKFIAPLEVIRLFNRSRISFVVVGVYGLAGWLNKPRATKDIDVVVPVRHVKKAANALLAAFPKLEPVDFPLAVRFQERETGVVRISVLKPIQQPYWDIFHHTHAVTSGGQKYRVPSLEMAILLKFAAMTSLYREQADQYQDAHDFMLLVENNPDLDRGSLSLLGTLLYPPRGGEYILEMVRKVQAGEKLNL